MNIGKSFKTEEILGIGLFTLSIVSLLIMLKVGLNQSIWEDEAYTLNLISKSFIDMVFTIAGHDVHPPLYYLILKSVFQFFSLFLPLKTFNAVFTFNSNYLLNVIVAKLTSTIPLFLLFIFSFTRLRKDFGWLISGIFAFCIITMPNIMNYGLEIRMYSWAMLFVTLSFYYSYKITIESSKTNWGMFIIFSLMGAYTHYYGTLAIAIINLILLLNIFLKNREKIKNWAISTTIITLGYIPWILLFIHTTARLSSTQWVKPSFKDIVGIIGFIFNIPDFNLSNILGLLLLITTILSIYIYKIKFIRPCERRNPSNYIVFGGFFVLILTMLFAIIFSILVKPMLYARYCFPMLGCLWLSFSILLSQFYSKKIIFILVLIILLLNGMANVTTFICHENNENIGYLEFKEYIAQINENDTIVYIGPSWMPGTFYTFYLNNEFIIWNNDSTTISEIRKKSDKDNVWVFETYRTGLETFNEFNKTIDKNGFKLNKVKKLTHAGEYPNHVGLIEK